MKKEIKDLSLSKYNKIDDHALELIFSGNIKALTGAFPKYDKNLKR